MADLGLSTNVQDAAAIVVEQNETGKLISFLVDQIGAFQTMAGNDLYLLASSGKVILPYDHHSPDEGLSIYLNDLSLCGGLPTSLNVLGTEFELLYRGGQLTINNDRLFLEEWINYGLPV